MGGDGSGSWSDQLEARRQSEYVRRDAEVTAFERSIEAGTAPSETPLIFNLSGQGGIGKTTLVRDYLRLARGRGAIGAITDHTFRDTPAVMAHLSSQLAEAGLNNRRFNRLHEHYLEKLALVEADPNAPTGLTGKVAQAAAKTLIGATKSAIPGGALVGEAVDTQGIADSAAAFAEYARRRLKKDDDVRLVVDPVAELSPAFLEGLRKGGGKRVVVLCFDTYEKTSAYLDDWLRALAEGKYGDLPGGLRMVISGRAKLDRNLWQPYAPLIADLPLAPFTDEQSRRLLASAGVTDPEVVSQIVRDAKGIPIYLATAAVGEPTAPEDVRDESGLAVERFLDSVDPHSPEGEASLEAGLARVLNADVFNELRKGRSDEPTFGWLLGLPFVEENQVGWTYHDAVRAQILRRQRRLSPRRWKEIHESLAQYYERLADDAPDPSPADDAFDRYASEALYHQLCAAPREGVKRSAEEIVPVALDSEEAAQLYAEALFDAAADLDSDALRDWSEVVREGLEAFEKDDPAPMRRLADSVLDVPDLEPNLRSLGYAIRALAWLEEEELEAARKDAETSLEVDLENELARWIAGVAALALGDIRASQSLGPLLLEDPDPGLRALGHIINGAFDEALDELDRAVDEDPDDASNYVARGVIFLRRGRWDEVMADAQRAIDRDSDFEGGWMLRSQALTAMTRNEEALRDAEHAVRLAPENAALRIVVARVLHGLGRNDDALSAINAAIQDQPESFQYWWTRGDILATQGRFADARDDAERALQLAQGSLPEGHPDLASALLLLGFAQTGLGEPVEGVETLSRARDALETNADTDRLLLGNIHRRLGEARRAAGLPAEAVTDFNRALELFDASGSDPALISAVELELGKAYTSLGDDEQAVAHLRRALAGYQVTAGTSQVSIANVLSWLGPALIRLGDHASAVKHLERALEIRELTEGASSPYVAQQLWWLGHARRESGDLEGALRDLERAMEIERGAAARGELVSEFGNTLALLGPVRHSMGDTDAARRDLEQALDILLGVDADSAQVGGVLRNLAHVLRAQGDLPGAKAALEWALEIEDRTERDDPTVAALAELDPILVLLGRPEAEDRSAEDGFASRVSAPRRRLRELRRRALAESDLSTDVRSAIRRLDLAAGDDAGVSCDRPLAERPHNGETGLAKHRELEELWGSELLRAVERYMVLAALSSHGRPGPAPDEELEDLVWRQAVRGLFMVEVVEQSADEPLGHETG